MKERPNLNLVPMLSAPSYTSNDEVARSSLAEVRNPVLKLPSLQAAKNLLKQNPAFHRAFFNVLMDLRRECQAKAEISFKKNKYILHAYWKVTAVYVGHIARAIR